MTRIPAPAKPGAIARVATASARRKVAKVTKRDARETAAMIEPLDAFAHAPALLLGYGALELGNERSRALDHRLKELVVLKAATLMGCEYCIDIGSAVARGMGISDEQLLALPRYRESGLFSELEVLALDYAVAMSRTPVSVPDELFAALREHLDERQLVELTGTIALENFRARFNAALEIGAAGFSEGMVCALPEAAEHAGGAERERAGASANGAGAPAPQPAAAPLS
jgi:4-carboxymuconolactone decarboxylase